MGISLRLESWIARRQQTEFAAIRLRRQRIYILPSGHGYGFTLMLLVMFLWSVNYSNNMGFALTFLLIAVATNSMRRCHNNLLDLQVHPGKAEAVFAGQHAQFHFRVDNPDPQPRYGITLGWNRDDTQHKDLSAKDSADFTLSLPAPKRGRLKPDRLQITTCFPLGLFRAWSPLQFEQGCLVYPKPQGHLPLPLDSAETSKLGEGEVGLGSEDFAGLRGYVAGDSPRHIAWKATAREGELLVKRFTGQARVQLWLDWDLLPSLSVEARCSQICQWVLKAEAEGREYGLRLPGLELPPSSGVAHRRHCLESLALFDAGGNQDENPTA